MTADIALSKAYSSAVMQRPTEMPENWRNSDPVFFTQVGRVRDAGRAGRPGP